MSTAEDGDNKNVGVCYGPGSIAAAVIVTIIVVCLLLPIFYVVWKRWRNKKDKNLVLETDPEKGKNSYAFDNDGFIDSNTPFNQTVEKSNKLDSAKSKWNQWSPITALLTKNEKQRTLDDSLLQEGEIKTVSLKSHDFTGLGFNIYGNMRDGIFIRDVLNRGPAFESGRLNPGDRIKSITINFDHVVYEDALTILSYASPYEVILEAQSGRSTGPQTPSKTVQLGHPMYRSSSATDLIFIEKTAKKRLFALEDVNTKSLMSSQSTSQKTLSNVTTLERKQSPSPQPKHNNLKTQLEQNLVENHKQQLLNKEEIVENDIPKIENKHQRFGIKVLPLGIGIATQMPPQVSPKSNELSQNDNNINLEIHSDKNGVAVEVKGGLDEVDKVPPPIKKREKSKNVGVQEDEEPEPIFERQNSINGSGIKRDKDGIPQEIPNHILNAAVAARKNRRPSYDDDVKSPKKQKGRAPAPPDSKLGSADYVSDSDVEVDNHQSSVNTIELNSNDITIHHSEEVEDIQNRKTASTGDLSKMQNRKISSSTLERAQSLDITDTGIPALTKKLVDSKSGSEDSLYGKALAEPRLSLVLDGLNTFQRSRLKKSTEWGNLEDAILNLDTSEGDLHKANSLEQSPHFDALVNKINEIKNEAVIDLSAASQKVEAEVEEPINSKNLWLVPSETDPPLMTSTTSITLDQCLDEEEEPVLYNTVHITDFLTAERSTANLDPYYNYNKYDTNVSDDIKVSRHSLSSSEKLFDSMSNISNITINSTSVTDPIPSSEVNLDSDDLYITALDRTEITNSFTNDDSASSKNTTLTETGSTVIIEGPTSLTVQISDLEPTPSETSNSKSISISPSPDSQKSNNYSLTYITEIQVTPNNNNKAETSETQSPVMEKLDVEKELHKIQEIAEEQLKKLPEMRFSTSSYESPKESYSSHIHQLRSNFEKSPPSKSSVKLDTNVAKSRIPVATTKTPPTSPERRDSRNFDLEIDKDIVAIMSSPIYSTPVSNLKYQPKATKNISVTSIRSNSKIPSGLPNRPPIPPRRYDYDSDSLTRISTNGNSSFKQWVFNPGDSNTVTNITVSDNKFDRK